MSAISMQLAGMSRTRKAWIALAIAPAPLAAMSVILSTAMLLDGKVTPAGGVVLTIFTALALGGLVLAVVRRDDDVVRRLALASLATGIILGAAMRDVTAPALARLGAEWGLVVRAPVSTQPY